MNDFQTMLDGLFWILMFLLGVDFATSGYLVFKKDLIAIEKPFFFGLLVIKARHKILIELHRQHQRGFLLEWMYSHKYLKYYALIGGMSIIFLSIAGFITFVYLPFIFR